MPDWKDILRKISPHALAQNIDGIAAAMPDVIRIADLNNVSRLVHFLGETAEESDGYNTMEEYASGSLYEGRHDLGNTHLGDGSRYKGRGLIETTGRSNYAKVSQETGHDFIEHPELLKEFPWAAITAALYWRDRRINRFADQDDIHGVCHAVNGGFNGLAARAKYTARAKAAVAGVQDMQTFNDTHAAINDLTVASQKAADKAKKTVKGAAQGSAANAVIVSSAHVYHGNYWLTGALIVASLSFALFMVIRASRQTAKSTVLDGAVDLLSKEGAFP